VLAEVSSVPWQASKVRDARSAPVAERAWILVTNSLPPVSKLREFLHLIRANVCDERRKRSIREQAANSNREGKLNRVILRCFNGDFALVDAACPYSAGALAGSTRLPCPKAPESKWAHQANAQ
jgi:hypothetical protein